MPAAAYEAEIIHFSLTMWLAESAGFSSDDAYELAKYDAATDVDPETEPTPTGVRALSAAAVMRRRQFHFVTDERLKDMLSGPRGAQECTADRITLGEFRAMGQYLHALEDKYAHERYPYPKFGHMLVGEAPDYPWFSPGAFMRMIDKKFTALVEMHRNCTNRRTERSLGRYRERLERWESEEVAAGTGNLGSLDRWQELTRDLYGARYQEFTDTRIKDLRRWLDHQRQTNWETSR